MGRHLSRNCLVLCLAVAMLALACEKKVSRGAAGIQPVVSKPNTVAPPVWPRGLPRRVPYTFRYAVPTGRPPPRTISVVGDFNDWSNRATPMRPISRGVWAVTVRLAPGLHHYRFSLNEHGNAAFSTSWIVDPNADPTLQSLPNAFGRAHG